MVESFSLTQNAAAPREDGPTDGRTARSRAAVIAAGSSLPFGRERRHRLMMSGGAWNGDDFALRAVQQQEQIDDDNTGESEDRGFSNCIHG